MEEKIILVTGSTGLVGNGIRKVVEQEKQNGGAAIEKETWIFVSSKDGDLRDKSQTEKLFAKYRPTHVIHLAAVVGGIFKNMQDNLGLLRHNMQINDTVLQTCFEFGVKKLVSCLSTCVTPDKTTYPIDETMLHSGPPHSSNYGYSFAKRLIDIENKAYHEKYGCMFTSVIPSNVFGSHDNFHLEDSHVIPGIIRRMFIAKERGDETFCVMGTGKPLRQFVYNVDVGKLILWVLREYNSVEPINLTVDPEDEVSIGYVAGVVKDCLGYKGNLVFDTTKPDGQYKKTTSNKKMRSYLPDFKFKNFREAMKETVDWYVQNRDTARN